MSEFYTYIYYEGDTPRYVGKGKSDRYLHHLREGLLLHSSHNREWYQKLQQMIRDGFDPNRDIVLNEGFTEDEAIQHERQLIELFGRVIDGTGSLYNQSSCNEGGASGYKWTEEQRQRLSESCTQRRQDSEYRQKQSEGTRSSWQNSEHRKKRSAGIRAAWTEERRQAQRERIREINRRRRDQNE